MMNPPTMRYDPDREVVWVWPVHDAPYFVTRTAIEDLLDSHERLSASELIEACEGHQTYFASVAASSSVVRSTWMGVRW